MKSALLVAAAVLLVAATPLPGPACPSPNPPRPEARHATGLALPTPLPRCFGAPVYEPLNKAHSDARLLAESHPNDFGCPWADHAKRELISVAKSTFLPQPEVSVRIRTVTRSYAQLAQLMDDIIDALRAGLLPDPASAVSDLTTSTTASSSKVSS